MIWNKLSFSYCIKNNEKGLKHFKAFMLTNTSQQLILLIIKKKNRILFALIGLSPRTIGIAGQVKTYSAFTGIQWIWFYSSSSCNNLCLKYVVAYFFTENNVLEMSIKKNYLCPIRTSRMPDLIPHQGVIFRYLL